MFKICRKCNIEKDISLFGRDKNRKDGYKPYCKLCCNRETTRCQQERRRKEPDWYTKKLDHGRQYKQKRKKADPDWATYVRKQIALCNKERLITDSLYRLACRMRSRTYQAFKAKQWNKDSNFASYIGCSLEDLRSHIEQQFEPWMNWGNHGSYDNNVLTWHIDHINPLSSAATADELVKLLHFSNLRPLKAEDNLKKGDMQNDNTIRGSRRRRGCRKNDTGSTPN